jgi:hypothetical protein
MEYESITAGVGISFWNSQHTNNLLHVTPDFKETRIITGFFRLGTSVAQREPVQRGKRLYGTDTC